MNFLLSFFHRKLFTLVVLLLLFVFLASIQVNAQTSTTSTDDMEFKKEKIMSEVSMQFHSLSGSGSPFLGASLGYKYNYKNTFGGRWLYSLISNPTNYIVAFYRYTIIPGKNEFFIEPTYTRLINKPRGIQIEQPQSLGIGIGLIRHFNHSFSMGGLAGLEGFDSMLPGLNKVFGGRSGFSPKISLMTSYTF